MPDFGAILRKAREDAVSAGATGAAGARSKFPLRNSESEGAKPGPGSLVLAGPPGPHAIPGPGGPSPEKQPGPVSGLVSTVHNQWVGDGGPAGPGGPSVKQHVREKCIRADTPRGWFDGLDLLDRRRAPCEGFKSGEWDRVHRTVEHFMHHHAEDAAARGWTALDLFGVHVLAGAARVDSCGALMLPNTSLATSTTTTTITFGPLVYRRRAMPDAVLIWDLVGEAS